MTTQPMTTADHETRHQTLVHLQSWHAVIPPYQGTPEEVHGLLHDDAEEACDRDHTLSNLREGRS